MTRTDVIDLSRLDFTWGDVQAASDVLVASARDLVERGAALWPPETLTVPRLLRHYPQDTWRVARLDGQAVAAYCLLDSDPLFWPSDQPLAALYLHKLAVHPAWQGHRLAERMLDDAVQDTRRRGIAWLKLDTATQRPKLRAIYENYGFQNVGRREVRGFDVTLYELRVAGAQEPS